MAETFITILAVTMIIYMFMGLLFLMGLFLPALRISSDQPFVSVIVAARNEEKHIGACLQSLIQQTYPGELYEIIVVNDRSKDGTAAIVGQLQDSRIKLITIADHPENVSGKKNALGYGVKASKGNILLFTDADCLVEPTWIEGMVKYFSPQVGFVIGFSKVMANSFFEKLQQYDFLAMMAAACGIANLGLPLAASGQNLAYRREAFDAVGGFESVKHRISGDDVLMMHLIRKLKKWKILFASDPGTFNSTKPEPTLRGFIHQRSRWASNADIMIRLNPIFFVYLLAVYFFDVSLVAGLILGFWNPFILAVTFFCWINKFVIYFLGMYFGAWRFRMKFSFPTFLSLFFLQMPYMLWVGIQGSLGVFKWKQ